MPSARSLRAGKAIIELGMPDGEVQKALGRLERSAKKIGTAFKNVGKVGLAAGGAVAGAFAGLAKQFAGAGDELNKMAARTGATVESLSELQFAAEQSGSNLAAIEKGLKGMARTLLDAERGLATATDNMDDLGISLADIKGRRPEEQFTLIASRIAEITDPTTRAAIAMKVFGRSGADLLPLFADGSRGIAQLRDEARQLGIVMSEENATAAAELTDALNVAWRQIKQVGLEIGAAVAGPLTDFLTASRDNIKAAIDWAKLNRGLIATIAKVAVGLAAASAGVYAIGTAFTVAAAAVKVFSIALALATAHPIILAITAVAVAVGLITKAYKAAALAAKEFEEQIRKPSEDAWLAAVREQAGIADLPGAGGAPGGAGPALYGPEDVRGRDHTPVADDILGESFGEEFTRRMNEQLNRGGGFGAALIAKAREAGRVLNEGIEKAAIGGVEMLADGLEAAKKQLEGLEAVDQAIAQTRTDGVRAIFDTRFAAQQFGGGDDIQKRQLRHLGNIDRKLDRRGGLNVI